MPGSFESSNTSFETGSLLACMVCISRIGVRQLDRPELAAEERARLVDDRMVLSFGSRRSLAFRMFALAFLGQRLSRRGAARALLDADAYRALSEVFFG